MPDSSTTLGPYEIAAARFAEIRDEYELNVLHDKGLYRHLHCAKPGTRIYSFDVVTWPGHLSLTGDLVSGLTFCRVPDMLEFFYGDRINPGYWNEKLVNHDVMSAAKVYGEYDPAEGGCEWEWDVQFLICCHAIQWAANTYLERTGS